MKKLFITTLLLCFSMAAMAQSGKVVITVVDAQSKQGVAGAIVDIAPVDKPEKAKQYISAYAGKTSLPTMQYGEYDVTVSFLGYETKNEKVAITAANREKITIEISEESTRIETVVMEVQAIRASTKGDTVSYNAGAFKVANDADVEGLLKKMPGITVSNGSVEAQGETVKKIFVDG
ncbi:MAG: carboxypeptidase-like regulatory domain-containing protein, partial [Alistipes sp.]|nr:carboxypeptidase-like regulatory domain-containing protein [Alistipes sp.]